jgi:hypothetical protein
MDEFLAWVVFPLAALAICTGIGLLAARVAHADVHGAVIPGLGFATAIALLEPYFATGASATPALVILIVAALAGYAAALPWRAIPRPGLGAAAGTGVYLLYIAPVALSGSATFLGYNLLNDTAIHLALVDWIGNHGSHWLAGLAPSSYTATINDYVHTDYPLGSHELLAALRPLVARDPALLYQPFIALSAGIAAAAIYALLPRGGRRPAALAAFAALASQLVFSFSLQGGIKELTFILCLATAAALVREPPLLALPAAALYGIYGVYALPWIVPLALLAVVFARPTLRTFAVAVVVFAAAIAVEIPGSIHYWHHGHKVIASGGELGPLIAPLKLFQAAGIWLTGDYRDTPATHAWITYALIGFALALALAGLLRGMRGPALAFLLTALVAAVASAPASSPYIDAKLLCVLSPAIVVATCLGIGALPWRRAAIASAVIVGAALLVSDALAYRDALLAPMDRLDELVTIDKRFAGQGPVLVNEFEEYTKHFMRRSRGSDPYEKWTAGRVALRPGVRKNKERWYDLDQMTTAFVERWPLIAVRRSPVASRPPSNYDRVWIGRFYSVWKRVRPAPLVHIPLGRPPFAPAGKPRCALVERLARRGRLRAASRENPALFAIAKGRPLPPGWYVDATFRYALDAGKGGELSVRARTHSGDLGVWIQGAAHRHDQLLLDGKLVGSVFGANRPGGWLDAGTINVPPATEHTLTLRRPKRSLRPGDARSDQLGPAVVTADPELSVIGTARRGVTGGLCGDSYDWIDVLR